MRFKNILSTVGTTALDLGILKWLGIGERMLIAACDSVATAVLTVTYGGINVVDASPLNIEAGTDRVEWPGDIVGSFVATSVGEVLATLSGTVAGCRTHFGVLSPGESVPW